MNKEKKTKKRPRLHTRTQRSENVAIYVLGPRDQFAELYDSGYGLTAILSRTGEDYFGTDWPIVLRVKMSVSRADLVQGLLDLASAINNNGLTQDIESRLRREAEVPEARPARAPPVPLLDGAPCSGDARDGLYVAYDGAKELS